jgi:hypothetical protein
MLSNILTKPMRVLDWGAIFLRLVILPLELTRPETPPSTA